MPDTLHLEPGEPYCGNCGYHLAGLTESAKCPECGLALVDVLKRAGGFASSGRRYRSKAMIMGLPAVHIAFGPAEGERIGRARGFVAIGDEAFGVLAIGGTARGGVAIGGAAVGVFSLGGFSAGAITAFGGAAVSLGLACGGGALGGIARGGGAVGIIADGGMALGYFARGGGAYGLHAIGQNPGATSQIAADVFDRWSWLLGSGLTAGSFLQTFGIALLIVLGIGGILGWLGWTKDRREPDGVPE